MTEAEFMGQILDLASLLGWESVHFRGAWTGKGYRTPVQGSMGKGWPDLVLVRPRDRRLIFAELKAANGRLSPEQERVLNILGSAGHEIHVWFPVDFDRIAETLR